ncbi:hypothetical protein BN12_530034 [Nostocoides japonicum T1-X7]|uniref:YD repeat-containing protein n=1 Tax=Nostocoides japonicum T1-X7 TaxID=1194083 RepID=A0A077M6M9_9MICO|nr:hypothetical protein BN12_530034 [Tetrasphaera japonica T1-X7]
MTRSSRTGRWGCTATVVVRTRGSSIWAPAGTVTTATTGSAVTSYGYDADGRTTTVTPAGGAGTGYTWDAEGYLAVSTGPAGDTSNIYDADGALLIAKDATGSTLYPDATTEIRQPETIASRAETPRDELSTHAGSQCCLSLAKSTSGGRGASCAADPRRCGALP